MDPIIQAKLNELRATYTDPADQARLNSWEKDLKKSSLYLNLRNHDAFKIICDGYHAELLQINKTLQNNVALFTDSNGLLVGRLLHERKRFIQDFLRPFEVAKVTEAAVTNSINESLNEEK